MIAGPLYGCFLAQQKRGTSQKMAAKEKVDFKRKMVEINKVGADDGQSPPPSLTPI